jgi:outer membrane receptor protein involved in Fe transport
MRIKLPTGVREWLRLAGLPSSLMLIFFFMAPASFAQDDDDESDDYMLEEVVVTGSRIRRRDFSSPSPITTINSEDFEFSGQPTLEEYLNQMPQLHPDYGRTSNNPGDGTAKLNLRGLGAGRTLVLLNGRRVAPSGMGSAIDVNNLPRSLLDRVEIITGGASTVYGSDAIAGVINFITRQNFDGIGLDASYNVTAEGDSKIYDANLVYGHNFSGGGGGNITMYAGYYERKPLFASEREISSVPLTDTWEGEIQETGSSVGPAGISFAPPVDLGSGPGRMTWNPDGTPRTWDSATDRYNYAPVNYIQTPLKRLTLGLQGNYDLTSNFEAYVEATFARNESRRNLAASPAFDFVLVNTDNPVLSPETRQVMEDQMLIGPGMALMALGRRMLELGPRTLDAKRDYTRLAAGIRGDFADGWNMDAWVIYTDASESELYLNDGSLSRFAQGLLVDPVTGQCFDPSGGCVPLDLFGEGRLSQEGADFIRVDRIENLTERKQTLASIVVSGAPFDIWSGPVGMAFGAEWRRDKGNFKADDVLFTGDTMGFRGTAPVDGTESVWELYTEALVPLIDNDNSVHYLGLELGVRYSDYKNAGSVWTYKAGLEWQPIESLRFRTMFQHSVRAPNNQELFTEQYTESRFLVGDNFKDPCSASSEPVANGNEERCILQGLPASQIGVFEATQFYPVDFTQGGNPDLEPESSDTFTAGVVITPTAVPEMTIAIDYFDLEVTDTIGEINAIAICFDPLNAGYVFCENIRRDQTGNIRQTFEPISNRGLASATGVDTQIQYQTPLPSSVALIDDYAQLNINFIWTHMFSNETQENIVTEIYDCAGYFGWPCNEFEGGGSFPANKLISNFDYISGPFSMRLTWRWIEKMRNAAPFASAAFGYPDPDLAIPTVPSYNYFDLGLGWEFNDSILLRLGINNMLDEDPPLMADAVNSNNTDTLVFDIFGRSYFASVSMEY